MPIGYARVSKADGSQSLDLQGVRVNPVTLYRYVGPQGQLRAHGAKVLAESARAGP